MAKDKAPVTVVFLCAREIDGVKYETYQVADIDADLAAALKKEHQVDDNDAAIAYARTQPVNNPAA